MNLDNYCANSINFHQLTKLIFFFLWNQFYGLFITLVFRVVWFKEQLCLSQMMHTFKMGDICKCDKSANPPYK